MVSVLLISESGWKTNECLVVAVMEESIETDPVDFNPVDFRYRSNRKE